MPYELVSQSARRLFKAACRHLSKGFTSDTRYMREAVAYRVSTRGQGLALRREADQLPA